MEAIHRPKCGQTDPVQPLGQTEDGDTGYGCLNCHTWFEIMSKPYEEEE